MKHILRRLWKSYKPSSTHAPVLWHLDYQESSHSYESLPISGGEIGIFGTQNRVMQPSRWPRNHVAKKQRLTSERDWRQSNTVENINSPGGTSIIRRSGGLDLTSSLEAKFGARSGQVHQIRGKTWEVLLPQDAKVGKQSQFWGHIWNSEGKIWGTCHLYFWKQNLGLQQEFLRQILWSSPPTTWYGSTPWAKFAPPT